MLYYAIWSVWVSFTLYANVSAQRTRQRAMLTAMFGIAVMAAAVPRAVHEQEQIFAIAYVACRLLAAASWRGTGAILTSWPAAQAGAGLVPWVVSIWVDTPARYWLWGLGVLADIVVSALQSRNPGQIFARYRNRAEQMKERYADRPDRLRRVPDVVEARLDTSHLGERLGLFVIMVLGEAVAQVVNVAGADWSRTLWWDVLAGFGLLVCLWWLTLEYGSTGATRYGPGRLRRGRGRGAAHPRAVAAVRRRDRLLRDPGGARGRVRRRLAVAARLRPAGRRRARSGGSVRRRVARLPSDRHVAVDRVLADPAPVARPAHRHPARLGSDPASGSYAHKLVILCASGLS